MLMYLPFNQPAVIALDKKGLKFGVCIGIILTSIGLILKCLINKSFLYVIVGQTLIASGQPFLLNGCSKLSANWFPEKERLAATAIAANSFILGVSAGLFIPSLFVDETAPESDLKKQIFRLGLFSAVLSCLITIPVLLTFKSAPKQMAQP
jgi:MFS family permease